MISRAEALAITSSGFPTGPEQLAERLRIAVVKAPLQGVEGWCIRGKKTLIRINSTSSSYRQRFTLAHELAHLVLGTKPDIAAEPFRSDAREERDADRLAADFLIPNQQLDLYLRGQLPVDARSLKRLARAANVSSVMAAFRVTSATRDLGLLNAALVFFRDGHEQWRFSPDLTFDEKAAQQFMRHALSQKPNPVRQTNSDGNIVVASLVDAQNYQVLFLQLLPAETANQLTREEWTRELGNQLFDGDAAFQASLAACLGAVKKNCQGKTLDEALQWFEDRYLGRHYTGIREARLRSSDGQAYLRLYLERWFN